MGSTIDLETVKGPFCKIQINPINLNSSDQVKSYLLSVGWVPTQWNINKETREQTSPKLTEDSFGSIRDDTGKLLARRSILVARRRLIQNLKDPENKGLLSYVREDGRIPAGTIPCATNTSRSKHRVCVNIPKNDPKVVYGKEVRALFGTRYPYVQLGVDLSSIEARVIGHWAWQFDDGAYWHTITSVPDIHQYNADLIGSSRSVAKSFLYSILFGAQAKKLSTIIGCSVEEAERKIIAFWAGNKGVKDLIDFLEKFYRKNKYIVGLDGRKLHIRQKHMLLNTLVQSSAAIIFKRWSLTAQQELDKELEYCRAMMSFHDEIQYRVLQQEAERAAEIVKESARIAGEYYNLKTEVVAEAKISTDWSGTH